MKKKYSPECRSMICRRLCGPDECRHERRLISAFRPARVADYPTRTIGLVAPVSAGGNQDAQSGWPPTVFRAQSDRAS